MFGRLPSQLLLLPGLALLACTAKPGAGAPKPSPREPVRAEDEDERWIDLDVAPGVGCAVNVDGELWCWGQLPGSGREGRSHARKIDAPAGLESVAVSSELACLLARGQVHCRGEGSDWQPIAGLDAPRTIVVGERRACAVQADGRALCWELLGAPELVASEVEDLSLELPGGCALRPEGEVLCWGWAVQRGEAIGATRSLGRIPGAVDLDLEFYAGVVWVLDERGAIHRADLRSADDEPEWARVGEVPGAVEIDGGRWHLCARTGAGEVSCAGVNHYGQLGDGSSRTPEGFVNMAVAEVLEVDVGELRSCVRTAEDIRCAGVDPHGIYTPALAPAEHTVPGLTATKLVAHDATTCAAAADGTLRCWGWASVDASPRAVRGLGVEQAARPTPLPSPGVAAGLFVERAGVAWIGDDGLMRHASWRGGAAPTLEPFELDGAPRRIRALGGGRCACAIELRGREANLVCGPNAMHMYPVPGVEDPVALAGVERRVCTIDGRARVVCAAVPGRSSAATPRAARISGVREARQIAMSRTHDCALLDGGRVSCWAASSGEDAVVYEAGPARDPGLSELVDLAASEDHFCSLDEAGDLRCWRPDGGGVDPVPVPTIAAEVAEIVAGAKHFCARELTGAVICWGDESHLQLGRVPDYVSLSPRSVLPAEARDESRRRVPPASPF